ncbi:MAG: sulfite exporter TauE/SafE family protein [Phycisphaeraceae bacterium]|nr:sulfite exporter TauE/SafE family protein [Phycisphaeraceae bacterium]
MTLALLGAVLAASLLGSAHCAGMCGAFVALAVGADDARPVPRSLLHAAYNAGRLATYLTLGALAGLAGSALDLGASAVGVQRAAAALAGALMILFGIGQLLRLRGVRVPWFRPPVPLQRVLTAAHRGAFALPPLARAGAIGLLTTLLPCGWLYAFVIAAAGTGDPLLGAAAMGAFWLGTLPMMVAVGVGVRAITGPLGRRLPVLMPMLLVAVGLGSVLGRVRLPLLHATDANVVGVAGAIEHVRSADHAELPCCAGSEDQP